MNAEIIFCMIFKTDRLELRKYVAVIKPLVSNSTSRLGSRLSMLLLIAALYELYKLSSSCLRPNTLR